MNRFLLLLSISAICLAQFVGAAPIVNGSDWKEPRMHTNEEALDLGDGCSLGTRFSQFVLIRVHSWFSFCLLAGLLTTGPTCAKEFGPQSPNIVLILADDMGYSDLGCYGGEIDTPNLDTLADRGLRFTQFYNTGRCWPTRASLLTGLYNDQTGIRDLSHQLNRRCVTIAEVLRSAGYGTYMVGKWHLMENDQENWEDPTTDRWPIQRGFDRFYGTPVSGNLFNPFNPIRDRTRIKIEDKNHYVTDALTDNAIDYIRDHTARRKDDPFLLYVAHFAPHYPLHARPDDIEAHRGRYDQGWAAVRAARYQRMIELGVIDKGWKLSTPEMMSPTWVDAPHKEWEARRHSSSDWSFPRTAFPVSPELRSCSSRRSVGTLKKRPSQ